MNIAVIGGGWAGLSAALQATREGNAVTLFEASRTLGGRARGVPVAHTHEGQTFHWQLDNGQHILIGAYSQTLALLEELGMQPDELLRTPLSLVYPDGQGLRCPDLSGFATLSRASRPYLSMLEIAWGITRLPWAWSERWALLRQAMRWRAQGFACTPGLTVRDICASLPQRVMVDFIEPLCVSALNTPPHAACAQVFLRVLQDALLGATSTQGLTYPSTPWGLPSHLLIARTDLGALMPERAALALTKTKAKLRLGERAQLHFHAGWQVQGEPFDAVILATSASDAIKLLEKTEGVAPEKEANIGAWLDTTRALAFEAIATVYAYAPQAALPEPMLALHSTAHYPAQFVFDRGQLKAEQRGLLAFVVSASQGDAATLQTQVLAQAQEQLGLALQPVKTLVEKRATFACTPALKRPGLHIAPGLLACGDYTEGPYPATLEGAVRSGYRAALALSAV